MNKKFIVEGTISDKIKNVVQSGKYEKIILGFMNESTLVFPDQYESIEQQSEGECDFINISTGEKFDAKLPISKNQGKLIGSRMGNEAEGIAEMIKEGSECNQAYWDASKENKVQETNLYKNIKTRITKDKEDENIILFFLYPVTKEFEHAIFSQFGKDILLEVFDILSKEDCIGDRKIYTIYPSLDKKFVLRCLNTRTRELISNDTMKEILAFQTFSEKE